MGGCGFDVYFKLILTVFANVDEQTACLNRSLSDNFFRERESVSSERKIEVYFFMQFRSAVSVIKNLCQQSSELISQVKVNSVLFLFSAKTTPSKPFLVQ